MIDGRQWSLWLRSEQAVVFAAALAAYHVGSHSWREFAILFLVPDLSMLGYLAGPRIGAIAYNLAHSYVGPAALLVCAAFVAAPGLLPVALIWIAHIGVDRMLGFGLKSTAGFRHTHLGIIGRGQPAAEP